MRSKLFVLAITTGSLQATGCLEWISDIEGWIYAGPTAKFSHLNSQSETILEHMRLNSLGVQAGIGLIFPIPFFFGADGAYSKLYSSLDGDFYTYEFKGGYFFHPVSDVLWNLYPLVSYNTDCIALDYPLFPSDIPPDGRLGSFEYKNRFSFNGPAVGFGTTYQIPYGFAINVEASWQWRLYKHTLRKDLEVIIPGPLVFISDHHSGALAWTEGPKIDLNLNYFFCNWFIGVTGEWQYLKQFKKSEGDQGDVIIIKDPVTKSIIRRESSVSVLEVTHLEWTNWVFKASLGFIF